jgi:membrane protease YdiL (CAAX protease family)
MDRSYGIEPMPFWQSLVLFGIPGIIVYLNIYVGVPYLVSVGVPLIVCFPPLLLLPVLLPASLVVYRREGNEMSWARLKERFRLDPIQGKQWLWVAGVFLCAQLSDVVFGFIGLDRVGRWLASIPLFEPPPYLPAFMDPRVELETPFTEFLGARLEGNWWILSWWLCLMFFSNLGEELMWRGYILPRQELSLGKQAWLVNGLLWNFVVHAVLRWQYIGMMPSMLLTPWLAQKLENTWASFLVHFGGNLLVVVFLLPGILGAGS